MQHYITETELAERRKRIHEQDAELATTEDRNERRVKQLENSLLFQNVTTERLLSEIRRINQRWNNQREQVHG